MFLIKAVTYKSTLSLTLKPVEGRNFQCNFAGHTVSEGGAEKSLCLELGWFLKVEIEYVVKYLRLL